MKNLYYYDSKTDIRNIITGLYYNPDIKQLYFYNFSPSDENNYSGWYINVDVVSASNLIDMLWKSDAKDCDISYLVGEVKGDNKIKLR
mgnify:CR=1 FL=1